MNSVTYKPNKTSRFFYRITLIAHILGLPNFWIEKSKLSKRFTAFFSICNIFTNLVVVALFLFVLGAFYTQQNLTESQTIELLFYCIDIPAFIFYNLNITYHGKLVKNVLLSLTVTLKMVHNEPAAEDQMIKKSIKYLVTLTFNCLMTMVVINVGAYVDMLRNDTQYSAFITAYPDKYDDSYLANIVRVIYNIAFWIFISRIIGIYVLVTPILCCLSYQFVNVQSYFISLADIFERNDLSQKEKETRYEEQFKLGIKLHLDTLRCSVQTQTFCSGPITGQIVFAIFVLVLLMVQIRLSERNSANFLAALSIAFGVLITTGFVMWNAGDTTVEASHLATAIYFSGWHNCQGQSSKQIRKMVAVAMANAQKPVYLKGFGFIGLSYETYLSIVKLSYSVFSVIY